MKWLQRFLRELFVMKCWYCGRTYIHTDECPVIQEKLKASYAVEGYQPKGGADSGKLKTPTFETGIQRQKAVKEDARKK